MARLWIAGLLLAAAAPSSGLRAQERAEPFVVGGLARGTGALREDTGEGWLVAGGVGFPLASADGLAVLVSGSYARIPYEGGFNEAMNLTSALGELRYRAPADGSIRLYLQGGAGLLVRQYDPGSIDTRATAAIRPGFTAAGGLDLRAGPTAVLLGARFLSGADAGFVSLEGGLAFPRRPGGGGVP